MSRIINLQTIRFQIFNVLDTWHTNWADDFNYSHLLYEDLGIRSYFIGVFYRLRMPTNYIYIHRLAGGNSLLLNTDIYFYKPLKRTKLHRYFIEQKQYYNYLLKLYIYLTPYLVKSINRQVKYRKYRRKYLNSLSLIRIRRFVRKGYLPFNLRKQATISSVRVRTIQDSRFLRQSYRAGCYSNGLVLSGFRSLQFRKKRIRRSFVSRIYSYTSMAFARIFYMLFYNVFVNRYVFLFKDLVRSLGLSSLVNTQLHRQVAYTTSSIGTLFNSKLTYIRRFKRLNSSFFMRSVHFNISTVFNLYYVLHFGMSLLRRIKASKGLGMRKIKLLSKRIRRSFRYAASTFYTWMLSKVKIFFTLFFSKLFSVSVFFLNALSSVLLHSSLFTKLFCFNSKLHILSLVYSSYSKTIVSTHTSSFINIHSGKLNAVYFFNIIRNIHRRFYQKKKARAVTRNIPRAFNYTYLTRNYVSLVFSHIAHHIETVLSSYTKQQVYFLYNLFYMGNKYYPSILNAKVLCDYFVYLLHTKRSMRGAFFKIRQWQIDNIKRRLSLESMYFKTQMRGKSLSYIDHLSYKKYPIIGIRIECSGNKKKGTMSRKTFYGDLIRDRLIFPKSPNNTFSADMDYYQSFAITKSCSIGVKVWVFFKTHIYDSHGAIRSLIVY